MVIGLLFIPSARRGAGYGALARAPRCEGCVGCGYAPSTGNTSTVQRHVDGVEGGDGCARACTGAGGRERACVRIRAYTLHVLTTLNKSMFGIDKSCDEGALMVLRAVEN